MVTSKAVHMFDSQNNSGILCNSNKASDGAPRYTTHPGNVTCNGCLKKMYAVHLKKKEEAEYLKWKESL